MSTAPGPLAGIRVLDLTTAWAGPMATRSLAYLGAEVIKIEAPTHLDSWRVRRRGAPPEMYPDCDPGERPYNRCALFNTQNHDKRTIALDLSKEAAREIALSIASLSQIVMANFTPGTLARLGLGYEQLRQVNPAIVLVEMPAFGRHSSRARHAGIAPTMEAACGMGSLIGYEGGPPAVSGGYYLDPVGGLHGAAASLLALYRQLRAGVGAQVELGQVDAAVQWIGERVWADADSGWTWHQHGNAVPGWAPHDAYPADGDDEWVAIAVTTTEEWRALCAVIGRSDLAGDSRLGSAEARRRHAPVIDQAISAWSSGQDKHAAADALQQAGVPAAPVHTGGDVATDPALAELGFFRELDHPEAGRHPYPGLAFRLERTPGAMKQAAPVFGADTGYVLGELLGMGVDEIARLIDDQVIWTDPAPEGTS